MRAVLLILLAAMLAACSSAPAVQHDPRGAVADVLVSCAASVEKIATSTAGDAASKVAAVGALERMCGGQLQIAMQPPPQQPSLGATLWQAAVQVADVALRAYGIKASRDVAVVQSNNQAQTTIASYGAFQGIANGGFTSNAAIASQIQAPAANVTNTYTLSGTGVLGSGTYTGPVTTTRNCNGGTGAAGGGGATAGGAGGAAPGGTC